MGAANAAGKAFDAGDVASAEALAEEIAAEGPARWTLGTTITDLELSVQQQTQPTAREALRDVLDRLKSLL